MGRVGCWVKACKTDFSEFWTPSQIGASQLEDPAISWHQHLMILALYAAALDFCEILKSMGHQQLEQPGAQKVEPGPMHG